MTNLEKINELNISNESIGIAIGNFDGVHLGHQELISNFVKMCESLGLMPVLISFNPHPNIFFNGPKPFLITSQEQKKGLLYSLGIVKIVELDFNIQLQQMSAEDFIDNNILSIEKLKLIYLGHDFRLGKGKQNSKEFLNKKIKNMSIQIQQEESFSNEYGVISSTMIRDEISKGSDFLLIKKLLGRDFSIKSTVEQGRGIGGKELVPTANLTISNIQMIPPFGVYITEVVIEGIVVEGVTNIGVNPTVSEKNCVSIETHLLNYAEDLYAKEIDVKFLKKVREEKKFDTKKDLLNQIMRDVELTKEFFRCKSKIQLALIGQNISHSKSQVAYEKLLGYSIQYDLIDVEPSELPSLKQLAGKYNGVSITAPFKKYYIEDVIKIDPSLSMINTLIFDEEIKGANTDKLAMEELLQKYLADNIDRIIILGDGAMSELLISLLNNLDIKVEVLSRRLGNLDMLNQLIGRKPEGLLVINSCSRDFIIASAGKGSYDFWDLNYNFEPHRQLFKNTAVRYQDGLEMLELQAKYALSFWNLERP